VLFIVLNDEIVAGLIGLVPAHLQRSHSLQYAHAWSAVAVLSVDAIFKPPPPVGAGGGYMFSGRPSVPLSVRASVRPSVIHVVVLCFRDISSICWRIFAKLLSLVRHGTQMT